eukprot:COSAG02_NODE_3252_length_7088_cov_139.903277_1_plen_681_part_00
MAAGDGERPPPEWVQVNVAPPQQQQQQQRVGSPWATTTTGRDEPEPEPELKKGERGSSGRAVEVRMAQVDAARQWRAKAEGFVDDESVEYRLRVLRPLCEMLRGLFLGNRDLFAVLVHDGRYIYRDELRDAFEATGISIYGDKVLDEIDDLLSYLDPGGKGKVELDKFAGAIQISTDADSGAPAPVQHRTVRSGAAGRPVKVVNQPSAIKAPIQPKAEGNGDALDVLFEGSFKQMLHAVGRRRDHKGERVDIRQHVDAFIRAQRELGLVPGQASAADGVVWTPRSSVLGDAGISAAQDARDRSEAVMSTGMEAVSVQNTLSEGMKFLMHAMRVKKGRLKLTDNERDAIEQLLNWDGGEIEIVRADQANRDPNAAPVATGAVPEGDHAAELEANPAPSEAAYDWGAHEAGNRAGRRGPAADPTAAQPRFTTNLNRKFFGAFESGQDEERSDQPGRQASPRSAQSSRGRSLSPRGREGRRQTGRPLPMLLSPRYAYAVSNAQRDYPGLSLHDAEQFAEHDNAMDGGREEELWKAEPENYYEKVTRLQLRDQFSGKEAVAAARMRAEERVMLSSCFEQNSAKLIGIVPSSKQRMTPARQVRVGQGSAMHTRRSINGSGGKSMPMVNVADASDRSALPPVTLGRAGVVEPVPHSTGESPALLGRPRTRPGGFRVSRATAATATK